ncbi:MAG: winged helix-turn-helix domain-containing protein, partial [Promethearchaeota archaeon]
KIDAPNQVQDLARNLNLNIKQLSVYLNKLERINLIRLHKNYYELTDRGYLIKEGIENEIEKINNDLLSEKSYIFRELTGLALIHLA